MSNTSKTELFETAPIPKAVLKLCIPTVLSSLVMVLYNLADTYFVGMLNDPVQNSAVTLAAPVLLAFNAVNNLFGVGSSSMMSRALGVKDYNTVKQSSAFGFYCSLFSGLLFSVLATVFMTPLLNILGADSVTSVPTEQYLFWTVSLGAAPSILNVVLAYMVRAEGSALHSSIGTMSGCALNIILDPIFIMPWGLDMGAAGAGCATFISNCVACLYFAVLLLAKRGKSFVCVDFRKLSFDKKIAGGICAVGVPAMIQNLLNVTGMTVLNNFTSDFGSQAVAAMGIAQKLAMIPMQVSMGLSQGIMPLIGYNYASKNIKRMKKGLFFTAKISLTMLIAATFGYFVFAEPLVRSFMSDSQVVEYGGRFLRGLCLAQPFLCMDFIAVGVFQACGMGSKALLFAFLRKIVLEIPMLFLLNWLFPLYGLAYAQFCSEVVLAIAAIVVLLRLFSRLSKESDLRETTPEMPVTDKLKEDLTR